MHVNDLSDFIRTKIHYSPETNCWNWLGAAGGSRNGQSKYGHILIQGKNKKIHRIVYEMAKGQIPKGMEIDHLCKNTLCCNPEHLEPVPHSTNCQRGRAGKYQLLKTHCPHGHEYTPENTSIYRNRRTCRICSYEKGRRFFLKNSEKIAARKKEMRQLGHWS